MELSQKATSYPLDAIARNAEGGKQMTDKEAIEMAIRTLVHIKDSSDTPHIIAACSIAISALQERKERQWINVKDRPPKEEK